MFGSIRKCALAIGLVAMLATAASATPTTVGDFRGTVQTVTSTGVVTLSLGTDTTIVRINAASDVFVIGMNASGGNTDGRIVLFENVGAGNAYIYQEHTSATSSDRFAVDANSGSRILWNSGIGIGIATYDGTSQRWRFAQIIGYNTGGPMGVQGDLNVAASIWSGGAITAAWGVLGGAATQTRLTMKSLTSGNDGSTVRWQTSTGSNLFSLGPDYNGNGGKDWWLYDNTNGVTNLYVKNTGTSYLSFGTTSGGIQYDNNTGTKDVSLFANGQIGLRLSGAINVIKLNAPLIYRRKTNTSTLPTLDSDCNGSGTATVYADSSDSRGKVTLGTGASSCTMHFAVPWDITLDNTNQGTGICTANASTAGVSVAITTTTDFDHQVKFTPSSSGSTTIYYHCDGIAPPTL